MPIIEIIQFSGSASATTKPNFASAGQTLQGPKHYTIGTVVQSPSTLQVTAEWGGSSQSEHQTLQASPEHRAFLSALQARFGAPTDVFAVAVAKSPFAETSVAAAGRGRGEGTGPAASPAVEFVQSWFPTSRLTPAFQAGIEADFDRFDKIFVQEAVGDRGWVKGWSLDEREHEGLEGGKGRFFFVLRGYESFAKFEESCRTAAYEQAGPILFAWQAPFRMWHVERVGEA